jgi:hypothetical protein
MPSIEDLKGKILLDCKKIKNEEIHFQISKCKTLIMYHKNDCCENVYIEDICGDLNDLIGSEILDAREDTNSTDKPLQEYHDSYTWTFYNIITAKGKVTIRWYGESNGYYSESVNFKWEEKF